MNNRLKERTLEELEGDLDEAITTDGPFSHNIIALILSEMDRRFGRDEALRMFDEYDLEVRYGFVRPGGPDA